MILTTPTTLTAAEAQGIATSIFGPIAWANAAEGWTRCPGEASHTTGTTARDLHVVIETLDDGTKPGCYCFHSSCSNAVDAVSFQLRSALGKRTTAPFTMPTRPAPPRPKPTFQADKLAKFAAKLDGIDAPWFAARSPKCPWNRTPASFLHSLYLPGEKVVIFDTYKSQGQAVWTCKEPPFNANELNHFTTGREHGVWFLNQPVSGEHADTGTLNADGTPHLSRRSYRTVTAWRYAVLESDKADPAHWLAAVAQLPLPIASITTSGGKSIHALVRIDADTKEQWDGIIDAMEPALVTLGADPGALTAVRLTRLPCCRREEKDQWQKLLYLNPSPDETPIADKREIE